MSSPFAIGGLASGIDTESLISKLMQLNSQPLARMQQKKADAVALQGVWRDVNNRLFNLQNTSDNLTKPFLFNSKAATSADATVVTATAANAVAPGIYSLAIRSLAQAQSLGSDSFGASNQALNLSGSFSVNGKQITVQASDTLNSLANKINATANIGVTATVVNPAVGDFRLQLTSSTTGASSAINFNTVSNSNTAVTVTTKPTAALDTYSLNVTQVASGANITGSGATVATTGTLDIAVGGQSLGAFTVYAGETAAQVATRLSSAFTGKLKATTDGSGNLVINTVATGSTQTIAVTDSGTGLFAAGVTNGAAGTDAQFSVTYASTGLTDSFTQSTNTYTDAARGFTFSWDPTKPLPQSATVTIDRSSLLAAGGGNLGLLTTAAAGSAAHEYVAATDADFSVNGLAMTRSTNAVSDAIPGLTLNLLKAGTVASPTTTTITVASDTKKVSDAIHAWVDQYNSTIDFITQAVNIDPDTKKAGPLYGDSALRTLRQSLVELATGQVSSIPGLYKGLSQIGIQTAAWGDKDFGTGKLSIDDAKLSDALKNHTDDVAQVFGAKPIDVAASAAGATASPDGSPAAAYGAANAIDGNTSSDFWGTTGGGWQSPTTVPASLQVNFSASKTIDTINLYMLDSLQNPAATSSLKDFSLLYSQDNGLSWAPLQSVTSNTLGYKSLTFNAVQATNIRLDVTSTNSPDGLAKVVELQAMQQSTGVASTIESAISQFTKTSGVISGKQQDLTDEIRDMDTQIANMQDRLDLEETSLRARFTAMETALSQMKDQSSWLASQIGSLGK